MYDNFSKLYYIAFQYNIWLIFSHVVIISIIIVYYGTIFNDGIFDIYGKN